MTVAELLEHLRWADNDRIIAIERPDDNREDSRYLDPTGDICIDKDDEYFVIQTN